MAQVPKEPGVLTASVVLEQLSSVAQAEDF